MLVLSSSQLANAYNRTACLFNIFQERSTIECKRLGGSLLSHGERWTHDKPFEQVCLYLRNENVIMGLRSYLSQLSIGKWSR